VIDITKFIVETFAIHEEILRASFELGPSPAGSGTLQNLRQSGSHNEVQPGDECQKHECKDAIAHNLGWATRSSKLYTKRLFDMQ
jgi:hypothetical protein